MSDQTRTESLVEVCMGTAIGFVVSFLAWPFVAAIYGFDYAVATSLGVTTIYTVLSIVRGYLVRRFWARRLHLVAVSIARRINAWR